MSNVLAFRKFAPVREDELDLLHGPVVPAEVYGTDPIVVSIKLANGISIENIPVYRISPFGVECDISGPRFQSAMNHILPGVSLDLDLKIGKNYSQSFGVVVATRHQEGSRQLFGVRWFQQDTTERPNEERRRSERWLCGEEFLPTGIAPNPTRFNDFIYFKVRDISSSGLQITTSLRNKVLLKGMILDTQVSLPMVGQLHLNLRVENIRIRTLDDKEVLSLGVSILDASPVALQAIGQYCLQFGPGATVSALKASGLSVESASNALSFGFVKSLGDYREVLALRHNAYSSVGKLPRDAPIESAGDIFDSRARIITAKHGDRLVGTVRIMFHEPEENSEHEQFVRFPDGFPGKHEIVEATRICTDPAYRGADLLYALMKQMVITIAQTHRRYLVGSATSKLMPLYEKLGFTNTGIKFSHEDLGSETHEILIGDIPQIISGQNVGPSLWNEVYSPVADYLADVHGIEFDPLMNARMALYRAMAPFTKILTRRIRSPKGPR